MVAEDLFLQYGALGLAAVVSTASLKYSFDSNLKLQETIDRNSDAMHRLSETIATCPKKR